MFLESVDARECLRRQEFTIHAQRRETLVVGPLGEIRVHALAIHHERRQQADVLAFVVAHDACRNRLRALRFDRHHAIRAVLRAQLHEQQAQEMMDLGQRAHRALATPAAGALLDRHRRRDAVDRIHIRARSDLHKLPGIGV